MVIMLAKKGVVLISLVLATMFLTLPLTSVNASKTRNDFYLKMYVTAFNLEWQHLADKRRVILHLTEEGIVKDSQNQEMGTIALDVVEIIDLKTDKATVSAKYEIDFYSGAIIEGTMNGKLQNATRGTPNLDGKFVGHGDMHVMGDIYLIMEGMIPVLILDGYSW